MNKPRVVVLGAGLAGLCSAYLLQNRGIPCTILEADKRVGGRVHTVDLGAGLRADMGAMRIPEKHRTTLKYVELFGLEKRDFIMDAQYLFVRGNRFTRETDARRQYEMRPWEASRTSLELWGHSVARNIENLTSDESADLLSSDSFKTAKMSAFDRLSLRGLIEQSGLSAEAIEYLLVCGGIGTSLEQTAATEHLREELERIWYGKFFEIVGGTSRLPQAFAGKLVNKPQLRCEVVRIEQHQHRVRAIYRREGKPELEGVEADALICTLPFPALARVDVEPGFSGEKRRAIRDLHYESATKVVAVTKERFWETDPAFPIIGGISYTDMASSMVVYPSDNVGRDPSGKPCLRDPELARRPGVLMMSYSWGQDARRLGTLPASARQDHVKSLVSKVHPQLAQPGTVLDMRSWYWDEHPFAGGAFAFYLPGQFDSMHRVVVAPEGRIYFAGEHCSRSHSWMQGALDSAERTVEELMTQLSAAP